MDETGPTTHPGSALAQQQLSKEGWLIKLSGYLVKSPKALPPLFNYSHN
jgi:hypothetical protein